MDAFEWTLSNGRRYTIFQVQDDRSRYVLASLVASSESTKAANTVLDLAISRFQVPQKLLTDNKSSLNPHRRGVIGGVVPHMDALGVRTITSRVKHPQTQGKNERVHQTLQKWLRARPKIATAAQLRHAIETFDECYNHARAHQALGMKTPATVIATGPIAIPPTPPADVHATTVRAVGHKVYDTGVVAVQNCFIRLGLEHANTSVFILENGSALTIFDHHGTMIRTLTLQPGRRYYLDFRIHAAIPAQARRMVCISAGVASWGSVR